MTTIVLSMVWEDPLGLEFRLHGLLCGCFFRGRGYGRGLSLGLRRLFLFLLGGLRMRPKGFEEGVAMGFRRAA